MLSDVVADQVAARRRAAGLNRDDLALRCKQMGLPLSASAIANIETGRRGSDGARRREITVDELVILGQALNIAPILLVFPVGTEDLSEVRPGAWASTWDAAEWFAGRRDVPPAPLSGEDPDGVVVGDVVYREPIRLSEAHDRAAERYRQMQRQTRIWRERSKTENGTVAKNLELAEDQEGDALQHLLSLRSQMTGLGIKPPAGLYEDQS